MTGYLSPLYAASFDGILAPIRLETSEGWLIKRAIPGTNAYDVMGGYPLFCCRDWAALSKDLNTLDDVVSLALVTDPFGNWDEDILKQCFPDRCIPYKEHFVIDLSLAPVTFISRHHQRNAIKSAGGLSVDVDVDPLASLDAWCRLYETLTNRHSIKGITAFSREVFRRMFQVPGLVVFRASRDDETLGMLLWYAHEAVAYYHLGAYSQRGYEMKASFPLFRCAIDYFADRGLAWLNLGAGAGVNVQSDDGLTRFKRGWATGTRRTYFCGKIFDPEKYTELTQVRTLTTSTYFPAYRTGEFET